MTKAEILKQIEELIKTNRRVEKNAEELRKQIEALPDDEKKIRTTPNDGDKFIYLSTGIWKLNYDFRRESFDLVDGIFQPNASIGNYFKSEEDARMVIKAMKIEQSIRIRCIELNNGWEPDWENIDEAKYYILSKNNISSEKAYINDTYAYNHFPIFGYYKSIEIAQQIVDEFNDDLRWYFNEYYPNKDKMYVWGQNDD